MVWQRRFVSWSIALFMPFFLLLSLCLSLFFFYRLVSSNSNNCIVIVRGLCIFQRPHPCAAIRCMWGEKWLCGLSRLSFNSPALPWCILTLMPCRREETVIQRIVDLEETLLRAEEKKFQLKKDVKARLLKLTGCWGWSWCEVQGSCQPWGGANLVAWWRDGVEETWEGHVRDAVLS